MTRSWRLAAILFLCLSGPALALDIVSGPGYAPFADPHLPEGGMLTDVVRKAYAGAGVEATITFLPWKRAYSEAAEGRYTATFPYVLTDERARDFLFSDPLYVVKRRVYLSAATGVIYRDLADLKGRKGCMEIGSTLPNEVEAMIQRGEISAERPADLQSCARMLAAGRADFFIINELAANDFIRKSGVPKGSIRIVEKPYGETGQHLLISRRLPGAEQALADFNAALARLKASGDYDRIVERHLAQ
ncbi:substrate-binding periplasmic protein [Lacibacterium aquatile]|uniref:Substrate-binding periplasmic protein n=1 Tax=Lacibacterium aquatile TaxID=1168082 RepID=A0ABW5DSX2_9PROT